MGGGTDWTGTDWGVWGKNADLRRYAPSFLPTVIYAYYLGTGCFACLDGHVNIYVPSVHINKTQYFDPAN